jgi:hypothetical protein
VRPTTCVGMWRVDGAESLMLPVSSVHLQVLCLCCVILPVVCSQQVIDAPCDVITGGRGGVD